MKRITFFIILYSFAFNNPIEEVKDGGVKENIGYEILNNWECEEYLSKDPLIFVWRIDTVWCEDAQTNLEINLCSGFEVCFEMQKFDSLNRIIIDYYDFEKSEQEKNGYSDFSEHNIDYEKLKSIHNESMNNYLKYCKLEKNKVGVEMGDGRERVFHENHQ